MPDLESPVHCQCGALMRYNRRWGAYVCAACGRAYTVNVTADRQRAAILERLHDEPIPGPYPCLTWSGHRPTLK